MFGYWMIRYPAWTSKPLDESRPAATPNPPSRRNRSPALAPCPAALPDLVLPPLGLLQSTARPAANCKRDRLQADARLDSNARRSTSRRSVAANGDGPGKPRMRAANPASRCGRCRRSPSAYAPGTQCQNRAGSGPSRFDERFLRASRVPIGWVRGHSRRAIWCRWNRIPV